MTRSGWTACADIYGTAHFEVVLTERSMMEMSTEQLEMLRDGAWLIEQAFKGNTEGSLTLPYSKIPVRHE